MSDVKWTRNQMDAISSRNGTVLVSAAAGSGKTAVLVERVIERLIDCQKPCDADKLLIVTFTNAAASEMRERISCRISQMIEKDPYNLHLQRQQILLTRAHISTIHGFCNELIRENFYKLDIYPEFRISDSNEMALLKDEAVSFVLEELYKENDMSFLNLVESFSGSKDDEALVRVINTLYDFVRSHPFPDRWMNEKLDMYKSVSNIGDSIWGNTIICYFKSAVEYCISITKNSIDALEEDEKIYNAYNDVLQEDLRNLIDLRHTCEEKNWNLLKSRVDTFLFERLKSLRGYKDDPLKLKITGNRDNVKHILNKASKLFTCSEEECIIDIKYLTPIIEKLFNAVKMFDYKLTELKSKKRLADFGDLEHLALKLLVEQTDDGFRKTEDAILISNKFDEIIVDEYQDSNEVQDIIFRVISRNEENLFVVGDVKQSIYRFRQAMPEIFLRRKELYNKYDSNLDNYPAKIILDKNFRSRKGVTDAVNFVFSQLMSKEIGEMDYTEEEKLEFGASYDDRKSADVQLDIIDITNSETADMDIIEARHIAEIIHKMVGSGYLVKCGDSKRQITYRDFCILIRNANKHAYAYAKELQLCGIPAWSDTSGTFFGKLEVSVILSFLRVIDNPIQDIPLLSVLMSPIYNFTPDKLSIIRSIDKEKPLYFALKKLADDGDEQCISFIKQIEKYRYMASTVSSDKLIQKIYEDSGYMSIVQAMPDGELRLANLRLLLEYARGYEFSGYKCLSGFIRFIDKLEQNRSDLSPANTISESANVVKIMSIHRSKGLEFPVCILAGCSRKFNKDKGDVLLHPFLGLGVKIRDSERLLQYSTMPRKAVEIEIERGLISEELRVLYVAMTRAKEKLIMLTSLKDIVKKLSSIASQLTEAPEISPYVVRNACCFSDWILLCAIRHPSGKELRRISQAAPGIMITRGEDWEINVIIPKDNGNNEVECKDDNIALFDNDLLTRLKKRLSFRYLNFDISKIPSKVSVSKLLVNNAVDEKIELRRPSFIMAHGLTAAEKGTVLHAFLQYVDYYKYKENSHNEMSRLIENKFLSRDQVDILEKDKINKFFSSNIMNRIMHSENVMREYKFTIDINAGEIDNTLPEHLKNVPVILQGAVDCIFIEGSSAIIVDYKTDKVLELDELRNHYKKQLSLYKKAVELCLGIEVKECLIYSFYLNDVIKII